MRKLTLLLLVLMATNVFAKTTVVTTLWSGEKVFTEYAGLEFDKALFSTVNAGDKITMVITAYEESDAKFAFKQKDNSWNDLTDFSWVDVNSTYNYEYTITATTANELATYGLAIQANNITVTQVTLSHYETATELWSGTINMGGWTNLESLRYGGKGELVNAKVGDDIRVTFNNTTEGCQIYVCDAASYSEFTDGYYSPSISEDVQSISFRIKNATVLEAIQDRGVVLKGKLATLTKIELVTYDGSYDAVAVTIGTDEIATFSSSKHLDFAGTGVTPYYASAVTKGTVTLTSTTTTWSWEGYILKGSADTYTVPVTAEANAYWPSTNYLKQQANGGTVAASTESTFHYIFAKNSSGVIGFYKLTSDHTLGAKKAYLETDTNIMPVSGARVALVFDDETTGVESLNTDCGTLNDNDIYNLRGQRVNNPTKGLYIQNGKKVFIK